MLLRLSDGRQQAPKGRAEAAGIMNFISILFDSGIFLGFRSA